jgi:protease-4
MLTGVFVGLLVLVAVVALVRGDGLGARLGLTSTVGVLELKGVIADAGDAIDALERFRRHEGTVAVVLRIESPGGGVAPSQELYDEVWRVRDVKPVVASLGNVAASGGYYVASAATLIVADPGTITGSIGAIMSLPYYAPLAEKVGVSEQVVKSGPFKDTGHPLRALSREEQALLQGMVDDVLGQFVEAVARGRGMDPARVRALADGRIYSGAQARAAGLVDELGGLRAATRLAWERAGQVGEPEVVRVRPRRRAWWLDLLGELLIPDRERLGGGLLFLYPGPGLE